jgi:Uma2 family endonuclease
LNEGGLMAVVAAPTRPAAGETALSSDDLWRVSVEKYHEMVQRGILTEEDPVELLGGWLVTKVPKNPRHRLATRRTRLALESAISGAWFVDTQEPITTEDSEPEPDVAVIRGSGEEYLDRHPGPTDLGLVVEVSDATLARDRMLKLLVYAAAGVREYWIVNLVEGTLEVHSDPTGAAEEPGYRTRRVYGPEDEVPLVLDGVEVGRIRVSELLP